MAKSSKKSASKKGSGKRTTIAPNDDKRYIKRDAKGKITESDDQGRSLSQDVKKSARKKVKPGYGDQGDQAKTKSASKKPAPKKAASKKSASKKSASKKSAPKKAASKKSAPRKSAGKKGK
jgi:hypothetical protein